MSPDNPIAKRTGGKHFSISSVHEGALLRGVTDLKRLFPQKKVNASSTLEWMIEKIFGKTDPELAEYMKLRKDLERLNNEEKK